MKQWELTPCVAEPTDLRQHLADDHAMPVDVLDNHDPAEWATWHHAEHKTRHPAKGDPMHPGHLRHTHPRWVPAAATASGSAGKAAAYAS